MEAWLADFATYAPFAVFAAAFFDTLFLTGYFLFGFALMGSVAMLYATGTITVLEVLGAAYLGTVLGSAVNYTIGYFGSERQFVVHALSHPKAQYVRDTIVRQHLFSAMALGRFLGITRPLYALTLGAMRITPRRVAHYELVIAFVWTSLWTVVMLFGERIVSTLLA